MEELTSAEPDHADDWLMNGFRLRQMTILPNQRLIVSSDGESQSMEDRVMMVLVELARHPHAIVSQEDFMNTVWSDTIVEPSVLSRAVALLRSALGDSARDPAFIKTYNRRGYELIADVEPLEELTPTPPKRRQPIVIGLALLGLLAVLAIAAFNWQFTSTPKLAVIPFTAPDDPALPMGGEGLADYLISALTDSREISIVARHDSFSTLRTTMDVEAIGEALEADYLVGGTISRRGDLVRLTLTLTDTGTEADVWSEIIEGSTQNRSELQTDALAALSGALVRELNIAPLVATESSRRVDDEAFRKYLEAQHQWNLRGALRINRAIDLMREAIALRPNFAEAHLSLAQSLAIKPFYTTDSLADSFAEARASLQKVTELTDGLNSEVNALKGFMFMEEYRWADAERYLKQALKDNPDNALAHYWYSYLLSNFGDFQSALVEMRQAAALNPYSAVINDRLALAYLWVNDTENATRQYEIATDLGYLESTQVKPAILHAVRTRNWNAIRELLSRLNTESGWVEAFVEGLADPGSRVRVTSIIESAMASGAIERPFWFGIWVLFEDADRAVRDFDASEKSQDIELLWAAESEFLRADPRFDDLVRSVKLSEFVPPPGTD